VDLTVDRRPRSGEERAVSWSIAEVARMSGITARTLRHYDAIGLLPPAWISSSGRRNYDREQLLRLQQILLLRELGVGLPDVARALDPAGGNGGPVATVTTLRRHRDRLLGERDRLTTLLQTVETTIDSIEKGHPVDAETMFEGFEHDPYEAQARDRWGDPAVDAARERMRGWSPSDADRARTGYDRVHQALAMLKAEGAPVSDQRVQALVGEHHEIVCLFWTPDAAAYRGLGQMYVDDERFRQNIGGGDDALVTYLRDAMACYADARLA
jgi:DNA-binding transcriptional MerR regulator